SGLSAADKEGDAQQFAAGVAGLLGSPSSPAPLLTGAAAYASPWRAGGVSPLSWPNPLATVKLTLSEEDRSEGEAKKKTREITLVIGEHDATRKQLLVKVDDWPRVEVADDSAWTTIKRPALAYRGKLFDFDLARVDQVTIEQEGKKLSLTQAD